METGSAPQGNPWKKVRILAVLLFLVVAGLVLGRPPRFVWGMQMRNPTPPAGHRTYLCYGDGVLDELRVLITRNRFVYVPVPAAGAAAAWPRLTGQRRIDPRGSMEQEQIELKKP